MHRDASQGDEGGDGRAIVASFGRGERECGGDSRCKGTRTKTFNQVSGTIEESVEEGSKDVLSEGVRGEGPCRKTRTVMLMEGSERVKDRLRKGLTVESEETCPVFEETVEENGERFELRSVGDPRTPTFALWQPRMPIPIAEGRAMGSRVCGVSSTTAQGDGVRPLHKWNY